MALLRRLSEGLARRTSRRGFFGRGADVAFGALIGAAAGVATRPGNAGAGVGTVCAFPGPPCACDHCLENGTCAKPCIINTTWYAAGCWVTGEVTCCDGPPVVATWGEQHRLDSALKQPVPQRAPAVALAAKPG